MVTSKDRLLQSTVNDRAVVLDEIGALLIGFDSSFELIFWKYVSLSSCLDFSSEAVPTFALLSVAEGNDKLGTIESEDMAAYLILCKRNIDPKPAALNDEVVMFICWSSLVIASKLAHMKVGDL